MHRPASHGTKFFLRRSRRFGVRFHRGLLLLCVGVALCGPGVAWAVDDVVVGGLGSDGANGTAGDPGTPGIKGDDGGSASANAISVDPSNTATATENHARSSDNPAKSL